MNSIILRSFIIYACISGILAFVWCYYDLYIGVRKEQFQEHIADTAWMTGNSRETIEFILYLAMLLFGWVFFPYKVLHRLGITLGIVKEEEEE